MKLVDLVNYFRNGGTYEEFCKSNSLDTDSEVVEVYMEKPFDIDKDLLFFEIEKTEGKIEYLYKEVKYFNLFDFYYFLDVIEDSTSIEKRSLPNSLIAKQLLSYGIHDA